MLPADTTQAITRLGARWESIGAAWLAEVTQRTGSERTPAEYGRYLARFMELVGDPAAATPAHVHAFAYGPGPSGRPPSPSTVNVRLAALQGFYDFARRMRMVETNPAADVKRPKLLPPAPKGLSQQELRELLATIPETPAGRRDRAIILTAVLTGLRRAEVMGLRAGDITCEGNVAYYYVARTKGGYSRRRELPTPAYRAITDALEALGTPLETLSADAPIFPVSSQGFYANLRRYARQAGLHHVTPHVLRHSAAKLRRESGASIEDVGALLGHRNLFTTARYLARLEGERDAGWHGVAAALGVDDE